MVEPLDQSWRRETKIVSLFLTLLLSHLVADFPLQSNRIIRMKNSGQAGLIIHSLIHVTVAGLLLNDAWRQWPILVTLGIVHWLIDWTKISFDKGSSVTGFLIDQAAHVISIVLILSTYGYWLSDTPTATLPPIMLYIGVVYGTVLGLMVLIWVWANSLSDDVIRRHPAMHPAIQWTQTQMLRCSQQAGLALIFALAIGVYIFGQPL